MYIMLYEQLQELYTNYIIMKPASKHRDYTYRAGDYFVTIATNQRNHRQIREGD